MATSLLIETLKETVFHQTSPEITQVTELADFHESQNLNRPV